MKNKHIVWFFCFWACFVFLITSDVFAFSFTEMGKGEEQLSEATNLFERGQYDAASERVKTAINHFENVLSKENPGSGDISKAQENLGYCYWLQHREEQALENFKRATKDSNSKERILSFLAEKYKKTLDENNFTRSFVINRYIIDIDPSLKKKPIALFTETAKLWLDKSRPDIARAYMDEVVYMDNSKRDDAARMFFEAANQFSNPNDKILVYKISLAYSFNYKEKIIESLVAIAKVFWFSVNWTFGSFVIHPHERRKVYAKEALQLHPRREGIDPQASPGRAYGGIRSVRRISASAEGFL